MSRIAAASGALYMLLVRSREQQAAESLMTSTCIHHIISLLGQLLSAVRVCANWFAICQTFRVMIAKLRTLKTVSHLE